MSQSWTSSLLRGAVAAVLSGFSALALAQATLVGQVVKERPKGPPVAGVQVWAQGASPTLSSQDGAFVLQFPKSHPGDAVAVRAGADKAWEVVNEELLDTRLPGAGKPSEVHLTIVVAKPNERLQRRIEYFGFVALEALEKNYRKQLAELEAKVQLTQRERLQERERLERELTSARALAQEWAKRAAEAAPQDSSGLYRQALVLFTQGKVSEALSLLSDERLVTEARANQDREAQNVKAWQLKAQLLLSQLDFEGAGKAHEQATRMAPGAFDAWFGLGKFNQELNAYPSARKGYERALLLARDQSNQANVATTLHNLGILSSEENRTEEARGQYEEALKIRRELAKANPGVYLPYVATTLNNLGNLSSDENRREEASGQYEEALKIRMELAKANPGVYLPDMAVTLNNLEVLSSDENRQEEARGQYEEALKIRMELAKANPGVYLPDVAATLNILGNLSRYKNRKEEARGQYEEALKSYRELAKANPGVYLPYVATTLNNLGNLSSDENRKEEARGQIEEALKIRKELAKANPGVYLPYVALTLNNLGFLNSQEHRTEEAKQQYQEALAIYRRFEAQAPGVFARDIPRVERNLKALEP